MFKIAIVEDNRVAMEKLQSYLDRYAQDNGEIFDIAVFGDALAFHHF